MALPLPSPIVELAPFTVDWKDSIHPTKSIPSECQLLKIEFIHPSPAQLLGLFKDLEIDFDIAIGEQSQIKLKIISPNGIVELS